MAWCAPGRRHTRSCRQVWRGPRPAVPVRSTEARHLLRRLRPRLHPRLLRRLHPRLLRRQSLPGPPPRPERPTAPRCPRVARVLPGRRGRAFGAAWSSGAETGRPATKPCRDLSSTATCRGVAGPGRPRDLASQVAPVRRPCRGGCAEGRQAAGDTRPRRLSKESVGHLERVVGDLGSAIAAKQLGVVLPGRQCDDCVVARSAVQPGVGQGR